MELKLIFSALRLLLPVHYTGSDHIFDASSMLNCFYTCRSSSSASRESRCFAKLLPGFGPGGQPRAEGDFTVNWEMLWIILARIVFQKGDALDFFWISDLI